MWLRSCFVIEIFYKSVSRLKSKFVNEVENIGSWTCARYTESFIVRNHGNSKDSVCVHRNYVLCKSYVTVYIVISILECQDNHAIVYVTLVIDL